MICLKMFTQSYSEITNLILISSQHNHFYYQNLCASVNNACSNLITNPSEAKVRFFLCILWLIILVFGRVAPKQKFVFFKLSQGIFFIWLILGGLVFFKLTGQFFFWISRFQKFGKIAQKDIFSEWVSEWVYEYFFFFFIIYSDSESI
jgi:hypothetical protein